MTWGEPCGARYIRRCGVMRAPPRAACNIPCAGFGASPGLRGKYGGNKFFISNRDSQNLILQNGESPRPDGRYQYKYNNADGKPKFAYSWKLVSTDKLSAGKQDCIALRDKIKQIQKDLDDSIDTIGKKMTVCQLYAKYIRQRGNVKREQKSP